MDDIFTIIATFLDIQTICACITSCTLFNRIMNKDIVWLMKSRQYGFDLYWIANHKEQFRVCYVLNKFMSKCWEIVPLRGVISLQQLYLNDNRLQSLPVEIGYLTVLQTLDLSNNKLCELPV